jgi:hypothetical protein
MSTTPGVIKIVRVNNGDVIIADIMSQESTYIEVSMPFLVSVKTEMGMIGVGLNRWDPVSDSNITVRIFKTSIISIAHPTHNMLKSYLEAVTELYNDSQDEDELDLDTEETYVINTSHNIH